MRAVPIALAVLLSVGVLSGPAHADDRTRSVEYFAGRCSFAVLDEGPPQSALMPKPLSGTTSGSGTCSGTLTDSSGEVRLLDAAATRFFADLEGFGGCDAARFHGPGRLTFPDGQIDVDLVDSYVGPVATGRLDGKAGGSADLLFTFSDRNPAGAIQECLAGTVTEVGFQLALRSNGISG